MELQAPIISSGRAIGEGAISGMARFIQSPSDLTELLPGEILLADEVPPDWDDQISDAACIITNRRDEAGRADILAHKLGIPVVVETVSGAARSWSGAWLEVTCRNGIGIVRELPTGSR